MVDCDRAHSSIKGLAATVGIRGRQVCQETNEAIVELVPRLGGSVTAFDLKKGGEQLPIRRWTGEVKPRVRLQPDGSNRSNRISGGPDSHSAAPSTRSSRRSAGTGADPRGRMDGGLGDGGEKARQCRAQAAEQDDSAVRLRGVQVFSLAGGPFEIELAESISGSSPSPADWVSTPGSCAPDVKLQAKATSQPNRAAMEFPPKTEAAPIPQSGTSARSGPLGNFIDNGYTGWDGHARIEWSGRGGITAMSRSDAATRCCHVLRSVGAADLLAEQ